MVKKKHKGYSGKRISKKHLANFPTLDLKTEKEIAMDFATKVYQKFDKLIKSIILFGSVVKESNVVGSDVDVIIILDDASIRWDEELVAWYREELGKIVKSHPYKKELHINTIKLTTWWSDLIRGDPVVVNVIRYGEPIIDFGGFFTPLKSLLIEGKIRSTPEAIYAALQRAPEHILRSKISQLNSIDGLYWAMVDSAHAALIAAGISPPSPEHVPSDLKQNFVDSGKLKMNYVVWYRDLLILHKRIMHGQVESLKGVEIDDWRDRTEDFVRTMAKLVESLLTR